MCYKTETVALKMVDVNGDVIWRKSSTVPQSGCPPVHLSLVAADG